MLIRKDSVLINVRLSNDVRIYYNGEINCHFSVGKQILVYYLN